ncbi:choice-of-anchor D domain-containing protein [Occallatibacter riparius]|uniref:Choice-of-anchor D domain-containing protein n=1 Tax=Occallatibacter riparius TaxID=1002689 RepID=A0A9J7BWN0_9BACT|nr:choice-of-anchor D domain-containing protein [Occallatibacter riparius]UWZ86218.1 choice-of-anchor D domain-containing protein [Occallatibacter riparius]
MGAGQLKVFGAMGGSSSRARFSNRTTYFWGLVLVLAAAGVCALPAQQRAAGPVPPRVLQARRFMAARGGAGGRIQARSSSLSALDAPAAGMGQWEPLGPKAVITPYFGLVTGRVSTLALDPSDTTGNTLYAGTTGGGVWLSTNAATGDATKVRFTALTDLVPAMTSGRFASISIGALTVQPGGTGVVLAGTGDPNDALDSYYGAGLLRSADGGKTWALIPGTTDKATGQAASEHLFLGEGFAGFAWSTADAQVVVAAVSQSYESSLVNAGVAGFSCAGLYYSTDAGATWHFAEITDGDGQNVQGPADVFPGTEGNAATAVVWNAQRGLFIAAVRFHGYYSSPDGVTWTRMAAQPGSGLTTALCPANTGLAGSPACPIFRGALAVNPLTGDTFAWTVDENNQDVGLWQDSCNASGKTCGNAEIKFATQVNMSALETSTLQGARTIRNGDYNLALAAVPADKDTVLLTGANDWWKCSLAAGCKWRNVTNSTTCMSAQVGEYQHAIEWDAANPLEMFIGNDSGLWRSEDGMAESGSVCSASDADHFQNLNGAIGSLAEVESVSQVGDSPYTLMMGLGVNGTAGVKGGVNGTAGPTDQWPQILGGEGGPVAVDPTDANKWYVNNGAGVSIHLCDSKDPCTPEAFGDVAVVGNADVGNDGLTMTTPAPFVVDAGDAAQLLVATCRIWRGPASGGWTQANAVTPMLGGGASGSYCAGNALIRSVAALALKDGGEIVYAGTYGTVNGGANLGGHLLKATMGADGTWSGWSDLSGNPVSNDNFPFNHFGLDISSVVIDAHDATGNTLYATIAGIPNRPQPVKLVYRSVDGGAHWKDVTSNLLFAPVNGLIVDPVDANTVYVATDRGVYATRTVTTCGDLFVSCWFPLGAGLPEAPVTVLSASPTTASPNVLVAGTYGRGAWQIPLLTAGQQMTTATVSPTSLTFADQGQGTTSDAQTITLTNTSAIALVPTLISTTGDFAETDNCAQQSVDYEASCTIQVTFSPTRLGSRTGKVTVQGNISGGNIAIDLTGTGVTPPQVSLQPTSIDFGDVESGTTSEARQVTAENAGGASVSIKSVTVTGPFVLGSNGCGTESLAPNTDCQMTVKFAPASPGAATGVLTMVDGAGTQTVKLSGNGTAPPTDTLSASSLTFPATVIGVTSAAQTVTITNSGGNPLTSIAVSVTGAFQQNNNCTTQLAAHASCAINVVYLPTAAGKETGTLSVGDILKTQTVSLAGTGLLPPAIAVSPTSLTFSNQLVNTTSAPLTLTVSNTGGAPMSDVGFQISGTSASNFATGATTCGATLGEGKSCTVQLTFTPTATGTMSATLTVTSSSAQVNPVKVPLSGNGQADGGLKASPSQLMFAATALSQASAAQSVTITNDAHDAAEGLNLATTGPFSLTQNTCGTTLASGASCTTGVVFTPAQKGSLAGALTITSTSVVIPATVALSGIGGLNGAVQMQPAQVAFPTTGVGTSSSPVAVRLTNIGAGALDNFVLTTSAGFTVASTTCSPSLAAGANCAVNVVFSPAAPGAVTGELSIASSGLDAPATVQLSGVGFDFSSAATGSTSQTVASGQTATYTLTLTPNGGQTSTFAFQCSGLPDYAACVFNPSNLSVMAGSTGSETVQITTSQSSAALERRDWRSAALPVSFGVGLLLVPLGWRRRRGAWLALVLMVCVGAIAGCAGSGGGGGGTPPPPTTHSVAPGSYVVSVGITSNGVQHTLNLTLVVD